MTLAFSLFVRSAGIHGLTLLSKANLQMIAEMGYIKHQDHIRERTELSPDSLRSSSCGLV